MLPLWSRSALPCTRETPVWWSLLITSAYVIVWFIRPSPDWLTMLFPFCSGRGAFGVLCFSPLLSVAPLRRKNGARPPSRGAQAGAVSVLVPSAPLVLVHSVPPYGGARGYRPSPCGRHSGSRFAPFFFGWRDVRSSAGVFQIKPCCGAVALAGLIIWNPSPAR